jgi:hypothetical protein
MICRGASLPTSSANIGTTISEDATMDDFWETVGLAGLITATISAIATFICNIRLEALKERIKRFGDADSFVTKAEFDSMAQLANGASAAMASGYASSQERRLQAIESMWRNIVALRHFTAPIMYVYDLYPPGPYPNGENVAECLPDVSSSEWLRQFLELVKGDELCRPFVGEHLWQEYYVYRSVTARTEVRLMQARDQMSIPRWNDALLDSRAVPDDPSSDQRLEDALNLIIDANCLLTLYNSDCKGVPRRILTAIETKIMRCMNAWVIESELARRDMDERLKVMLEVSVKDNLTLLALRQSAEQLIGAPIP